MNERGGRPDDPLFPTRRGTPISRGAVGRLVAKHAAAAAEHYPSLRDKKISPTCYATPAPCPCWHKAWIQR
jgi:integrase/recombinase XerD